MHMDLHRSKPVRDPEDNDSDYGSEISTEDEIIIQKLIDIRARTNQSPESVHARNEQSETQPDSDVLHYIDEEVIPIYDTLRDDPIEIDDGTYGKITTFLEIHPDRPNLYRRVKLVSIFMKKIGS